MERFVSDTAEGSRADEKWAKQVPETIGTQPDFISAAADGIVGDGNSNTTEISILTSFTNHTIIGDIIVRSNDMHIQSPACQYIALWRGCCGIEKSKAMTCFDL